MQHTHKHMLFGKQLFYSFKMTDYKSAVTLYMMFNATAIRPFSTITIFHFLKNIEVKNSYWKCKDESNIKISDNND